MLIEEDELERRAAELRGRLSDWEWGYLVGLIEGEGSLSIDYLKKTGRYYPRIVITNTNLKVLEYFQSKLKIGSIQVLKRREGWREAYQWSIKGKEGLILLKTITKLFFSCKKSKAALLLALNKCNYGPYAEKIRSRVKHLNGIEENFIIYKKAPPRSKFLIKNNIIDFERGILAALLDTEGFIRIDRPSLDLKVGVISTCPLIINKILNLTAGWRIYVERRPPYRMTFRLRLHDKAAANFLETIKDFLIIKKDRADIALEFAKTLGQPPHPLPASVKKLREELYWKLRVINQRRTSRYGSAVLAPASHIPRGIDWGLPRPLLSIDI